MPKKVKKQVYVADFESNNSDIAIKEGKTFVWLWDICNIYSLNHRIGNSLDEFFEHLDTFADSTIYFHNLKFDGTFIIYWLLKNGYEWTHDRDNIKEHQAYSIISTSKQFYAIIYRNKQNALIEFRDSSKKIAGTVESIAKSWKLPILKGEIDYKKHHTDFRVSLEDIEYIKHDTEIIARVMAELYNNGMTTLTSASDSMSAYKVSIGKKNFEHRFPTLDMDVDDFIRSAYYGAYCIYNPKYLDKIVTDVKCYDKNSMYTHQMVTKKFPLGTPRWFDGEPKFKDRLFIVKVLVRLRLKPNRYPCLMYKSMYSQTNVYIYETRNEVLELNLTSVDYFEMLKHYDIIELEHVGGYYFTSSYTLFTSYLKSLYVEKQTSTGAKKQTAKIKLNSFYGKFATNPRREIIEPCLEDDVVKFKSLGSVSISPVYTAVSAFTTAYARRDLHNAIMKNYDTFVYGDTDSIHTTKDAVGIEIDDDKLGAWKLEKEYKTFKVLGQKTYIGELKDGDTVCKSCGCPFSIRSKMTFDDFKIGATFTGKLIPRNVKGGVVLVETEFTLKERLQIVARSKEI